MKKTNIFKKIYALAGVSFVLLAKKCVLTFKIKSQYKNLGKLDNAIAKYHGMLFNPYRISNGLRPTFGIQKSNATSISRENLERCHEIISQKRQNESKE
ncbi:MAG: hypothetical protein E7522_02115 [Ruminococcaceae bacterium]|nr:hypothetical protein [Oscillospiraceae bacterium]